MVLGRLPLYGELEASPDCSQASSLSAEEIVVVYHERTKHHYHRFAAYRVSGGFIPRGALVHSLARGLEVWRARVPVLPT